MERGPTQASCRILLFSLLAPLLLGQSCGPLNGAFLWDNASQYTVVTVDTQGQGEVSLSPPGGTYPAGTEVSLTPSPASGWEFDHWEGALTGNVNPATVTSDADATVTAVFVQLPPGKRLATEDELSELRSWADQHGISLVGIQKPIDDLYHNQYDPAKDNVPLEGVIGIIAVYDALRVLPDSVLDVARGDTIYFSTITEGPYPVIAGDYGGVLNDIDDGIIVAQPMSAMETLCPFGWLLAHHGIEGSYGRNADFGSVKPEYDRIFDTSTVSYDPQAPSTPPGYITNGATSTKADNFAVHFAYYVAQGALFRSKLDDPGLREKYDFLRDKLFSGLEY